MSDVATIPALKDVIIPRDEELGIKADPTREYVSAGRLAWYVDYKQALERPIDDVTRDFGEDVYSRMMNDPQIASCLNTLKTAVLAGGLRINPVDLPDGAPEADLILAQTLADFCAKILDDLETPVADVLWNMLDALYLGNKVAETVWAMGYRWDDGPKLELRRINVKPRESVAFVVDAYNNILGLLGLVPDAALPVLSGYIVDDAPNLLPRQKFFIFTFRPIDNDPRGSSLFRPLYNIWWIGQQLYPEWLKYLAQFATTILVGYTAENAQPRIKENADGTPVIGDDGKPVVVYPEEAMVQTLVQMRNGSAAAFKYGSRVDPMTPGEGGGSAFLSAFGQLDRWKAKAILNQTLATEEGQHQARAASEVHQDIFSLLSQSIKEALLLAFRRDVLKMLVRVNYGDDAVRLTPNATLGEVEQVDFASEANAVSTLFSSKYLDPTQLPAMDARLGIPVRPPEAVQRLLEQIQLGLEGIRAANEAKSAPPIGQPAVNDKSEGNDGQKRPEPQRPA